MSDCSRFFLGASKGPRYNPRVADAAPVPIPAASPAEAKAIRHSAIVRATHWITAACFLALLVTGIEIVISHPRFYWGETGNVRMPYLFKLPIPASRSSVPTGYGYVLPDQNGWSRSLHFEAAWFAIGTGLLYVLAGLASGHFRKNLLPRRGEILKQVASHLRLRFGDEPGYNSLQRVTYLGVIFVLFPLAIWTGLAMSPGVVSAVPAVVTVLGGQQSARTIHFFVSIALALFLLGHVAMVGVTGFRARMGAMITGRAAAGKGGR